MLKKGLCVALALATLCLAQAMAPARSYACSCAGPRAVKDALQDADAVFTGKVLTVSSASVGPSWHPTRVLFEVQSVWKGPGTKQVTIYTGSGGGDCGYSFDVGQHYLVYGYSLSEHPSITVAGRELVSPIGINYGFGTGICSRTQPLSSATYDLQELGPGSPPTDKGWPANALLYTVLALGLVGAGLLVAKRRRKRRLQA